MKSLVLVLMFVGSAAFAREVKTEIQITKGPYIVPVENQVFNALGSEFKSQGKILVFMSPGQIHFQLPRVNFLSLNSVRDGQVTGEYYYTPTKPKDFASPAIRLGFEGEKLEWLYTASKDWRITILDDTQKNGVMPTLFTSMSDKQITFLAETFLDQNGVGLIERSQIQREDHSVTVLAEVGQMGENDDEPVIVGKAKVVFNGMPGARTVSITASVKDRR